MSEYNPFPDDPFKSYYAQSPTQGEYQKEVPDTSRFPTPVILMGIYSFAAASIKDSFEAADHLIDIKKIRISPEFPSGEESFPAIQVGVTGLKVEHSGLVPVHIDQEWDDEHDQQSISLISTGQLSLNIYSRKVREAIMIQDFLTQILLLNVIYGDRYAYPGAVKRDYIAMGFEPGNVSWGGVSKQSMEANSNESVYITKGQIGFRAEHIAEYGLKRVSEVEIEPIPLDFIAYPNS